MADCPISREEINKVNNFLKGYRTYRSFLTAERYEKEFFGGDRSLDGIGGDLSMARARMFEVRHFIMSLCNSDEKLLLYFHYVRGESVERCGELLGISRTSAFRLKKKALALAARTQRGEGDGGCEGGEGCGGCDMEPS